jgi:2-iminobutanoate/2-iminopropanoate deaminase
LSYFATGFTFVPALVRRLLSNNTLRHKGDTVKEVIATDRGPKALGPYSQAIRANGFIFVSGQGPIEPPSGQIVEGDIAKQAARTLDNLKAILEAAGSSMDKAVKVSVFLKDMDDFAAMNEVYGRYFQRNQPARTTIEAARLPKDIRIEMDIIALA